MKKEKAKALEINDKNIYCEGKSKKIYIIDEKTNFMVFKPHLRSITSNRESNILGTDILRVYATLYFMELLQKNHIKTQLVDNRVINVNGKYGILVKKVKPIPIEFIARFYAAGSIVRLFPSLVSEGEKFEKPLYKYDFKQDISVAGIDDPTLNESYIIGLNLLSKKQFKKVNKIFKKTSKIINKDLYKKGIKLIDIKVEFGFDERGRIIVIDEISQDCIRANDILQNKSITKDTYRQLKSDKEVLSSYKEFLDKLNIEMK